MRQKANLSEHECSLGNRAIKNSVCPVKARTGGMGRMQRFCLSLEPKAQLELKRARNVGGNKKRRFHTC